MLAGGTIFWGFEGGLKSTRGAAMSAAVIRECSMEFQADCTLTLLVMGFKYKLLIRLVEE